jgi:hypothetical protein
MLILVTDPSHTNLAQIKETNGETLEQEIWYMVLRPIQRTAYKYVYEGVHI